MWRGMHAQAFFTAVSNRCTAAVHNTVALPSSLLPAPPLYMIARKLTGTPFGLTHPRDRDNLNSDRIHPHAAMA